VSGAAGLGAAGVGGPGGGGGAGIAGLFRVVKGTPDEAELAALVAGIVAARAATGPAEDEHGSASAWSDRGRRLGLPTQPGRDAWRWSARPYWPAPCRRNCASNLLRIVTRSTSSFGARGVAGQSRCA